MSTEVAQDLREFHQFVGEKLSNGAVDLSPEGALDEWRMLHPEAALQDEELAALREALTVIDNGDRGVSFEEFDRDFRKRRNLPDRP
jgi:hypothetical protein